LSGLPPSELRGRIDDGMKFLEEEEEKEGRSSNSFGDQQVVGNRFKLHRTFSFPHPTTSNNHHIDDGGSDLNLASNSMISIDIDQCYSSFESDLKHTGSFIWPCSQILG